MDPAAAAAAVEPRPKRIRRAPSELFREQQLRRQRTQEVPPAEVNSQLVAVTPAPQLAVQFAGAISSQVDEAVKAEGELGSKASFDHVAARGHAWQLERAATLERQDSKPKEDPSVVLRSSEDLVSDLCIRTGLTLTTVHESFRWLRRLPAALRSQPMRALDGTPRGAACAAAALQLCRDCLPKLMTDPDKAARWLERINACLCWYQVDGPPLPASAEAAGQAAAEDRSSRRCVEEWDEAYRSLEVLLRQGLIPSFAIATDRFSVTVFGDGSGSWKSSRAGAMHAPSKGTPCAVLSPSLESIRGMLQENHVPFEVALLPAADAAEQGGEAKGEAPAGAAAAEAAHAPAMTDVLYELQDLRRVGEKVVTPEEISGKTPRSSALWFEGAWRVHALLDVLRQHFLAAPLPNAPRAPARLPRLLAPAPFCHASVRSAEVLRTQTQELPGSAGPRHRAELAGVFFPSQVRRLLETLRVLLPSFACGFTSEARYSHGVNAFTQLGMRRIEGVECECTGAGATNWKWEFKLGA